MKDGIDTRYPYTYACDYIRNFGPVNHSGVVLSRGDAFQIRQGIAKALGMDDEELAKKLADCFKANEDKLAEESVKRLIPMFLARGGSDG